MIVTEDVVLVLVLLSQLVYPAGHVVSFWNGRQTVMEPNTCRHCPVVPTSQPLQSKSESLWSVTVAEVVDVIAGKSPPSQRSDPTGQLRSEAFWYRTQISASGIKHGPAPNMQFGQSLDAPGNVCDVVVDDAVVSEVVVSVVAVIVVDEVPLVLVAVDVVVTVAVVLSMQMV